jgi:hypothetical protein
MVIVHLLLLLLLSQLLSCGGCVGFAPHPYGGDTLTVHHLLLLLSQQHRAVVAVLAALHIHRVMIP